MPGFRYISRRANRILCATGWIAGLNFAAFWLAAIYLGGDALNGYTANGHYYICAHGACREVTEALWRYSDWHALSAFVGITSIFVELAIFINTKDIVLDFHKSS